MPTLADAAAQFTPPAGYLNVAAMGVPSRATVAALRHDLDRWEAGLASPGDYDPIVARARAAYGRLVGVDVDRVGIGSQTSAMASLFAGWVPDGAEVLLVHGDFTSMVYPFLGQAHRGVTVRHVPVAELADAVSDRTALVAYSLVQSATGEVADAAAIAAAARRVGARTLADLTQAAGVLPIDATLADATVGHAYKWLASPRGAAFLTVAADWADEIPATQAGWYAGEDVWTSTYGPGMRLADAARRFDVSPAWPAWVGAAPALELFADLDIDEVWAHATRLADRLAASVDREPVHQAIVSYPDPEGTALAALADAGVAVAGRAGRVRLSFHLWNTDVDVDLAAAALGRAWADPARR